MPCGRVEYAAVADSPEAAQLTHFLGDDHHDFTSLGGRAELALQHIAVAVGADHDRWLVPPLEIVDRSDRRAHRDERAERDERLADPADRRRDPAVDVCRADDALAVEP